MKLPSIIALLLGNAFALPVKLESGDSPVPDRDTLIPLITSAPDANTAADLLLRHYNTHHFPAVGVDVQDNDTQRLVTVQVSRFDQIHLSDGPARTKSIARDSFAPLSNSFVNKSALQSALHTFHANPLHRAIPRLQPSGDHVNALLRIDQSLPHRFSAGFLDSGARPLPRERFWLQGEFSDLWNHNSLSTARLTFSPDPSDFHALQLGTRLFLQDGSQLAFSLSYSGAQTNIIDAYTWQAGTRWSAPKTTFLGWQARTHLALNYRRSNNALEFGDATSRGLADVFQFSLGQDLEHATDNSLTRLSANLILSPFGDDDDHSSLRSGAHAKYGILRTNFWHRQNLPAKWDLIANLGGQWSSDPVLQADQLALGGASGLRGLPDQFALGDSGYLGGLELRSPVISLSDWKLRPSLVLQHGETFDQVLDTSTSATTAGLALQLGYQSSLRASLHAGWRLDEPGTQLHTQLTWKF